MVCGTGPKTEQLPGNKCDLERADSDIELGVSGFITHWPFLEKKMRASSKASLFSSCPFPFLKVLVRANMQTETTISPDSFAWVKFSVSFGLFGNLGITRNHREIIVHWEFQSTSSSPRP